MINEAVIPSAGLGTRMLPVTGGKIPKLMLEINGKPMIAYAVEEALSSGFDKINVVVNGAQAGLSDFLKENYGEVNVIPAGPRGSGGNILDAKKSVKGDHFAVIFPDVIIDSKVPALLQLKRAFEKNNVNIIGWLLLTEEEKKIFGNSTPVLSKQIGDNLFEIRGFAQKKSEENSLYLSRYILSRSFFQAAERLISGSGEADDADVLKEMIRSERFLGTKISGKGFDGGNVGGYRAAEKYFLSKGP